MSRAWTGLRRASQSSVLDLPGPLPGTQNAFAGQRQHLYVFPVSAPSRRSRRTAVDPECPVPVARRPGPRHHHPPGQVTAPFAAATLSRRA